jgi:hypothetical protein
MDKPHAEPAALAVLRQQKKPRREQPRVLNCGQLLEIRTEVEAMLFEGFPLPARGVALMVGTTKAGKTLLSVQTALSVASGKALFDFYKVPDPGAVMVIEQDDPSGAAAIKTIVERSGGTRALPLYVVEKMPFGFGPALLDWISERTRELSLRLIVIDSYTAMRGPRTAGVDFVKQEQAELTGLDAQAKTLGVAVILIHHASKGAAGLDWAQSAAGSYAVAAATESQIHVARFPELDGAAPERLVRIRGRHAEDGQMVLRFRKDTLDFGHVIEGAAAPLWPLIEQIRREFGEQTFSAKDLCHLTGLSRSTAHRQLDRLRQADVIRKIERGEYRLDKTLGAE